jgi:hypothetical protein
MEQRGSGFEREPDESLITPDASGNGCTDSVADGPTVARPVVPERSMKLIPKSA